ncbi:hypothetical protein [Sphingomonas psychrotolerans]|uniref:Flagellar FliJ protein n=1 Tax=Sphingomonas psychrotolerans TaxID=1327635 RepID=A0A2K8MJD2_9SPHN|nr:hypothetical protein [Sphingomonas psychrotolerans]ATY31859.1 hypothetical protein CVN68_07650 [Sphingomonas psychrotolerans]
MRASDQRRQAQALVRLRAVRMQSAAAALAEARAATAAAERERAEADAAADTADAAMKAAHADLATDPAEAERLLAVVDRSQFRRSVARTALNDAREAEQLCGDAEAERRKAMILARARHDRLAEHAGQAVRRWERRQEERTALDNMEARRRP